MKVAWVLLALTACNERKQAVEEAPAPVAVPPSPMRDIDEIKTPEEDANGASDWSTTKTCALQDAELIYVVDESNRLLSFDPRKLPHDAFHLIGKLSCTRNATPNSMAVDRRGVAWIGYQNGNVHRASIITAKCDPKGWKPKGNATRVFGMGFATRGPRVEEEDLYVAGGLDDPNFQLATIDTTAKTWNPIGTLSIHGHPELTGTSEGKLYAYYPSPGRGFVQEVDRVKGTMVGPLWKIPGDAFNVEAYAFAHYGGVFYVFSTVGGVSAIHAVHAKTGKVELVKSDTGYTVVGAGVSTCAPLLEAPP